MKRSFDEYEKEFARLNDLLKDPNLSELDRKYIESEIEELDHEYKVDTFHISMCVEDNYE